MHLLLACELQAPIKRLWSYDAMAQFKYVYYLLLLLFWLETTAGTLYHTWLKTYWICSESTYVTYRNPQNDHLNSADWHTLRQKWGGHVHPVHGPPHGDAPDRTATLKMSKQWRKSISRISRIQASLSVEEGNLLRILAFDWGHGYQGRRQVQQYGVRCELGCPLPVGVAMLPSQKKWNFAFEKACLGAFWASWCGDCLDVTAYSSVVFILLQTDLSTEAG